MYILVYTGNALENKLELIQGCALCPKQTFIYECTILGTPFGLTVWTGSVFDCSLGEILLLHRLFAKNAIGACNDGSIVAEGLRVENDSCYISQLRVTVSHDMIGKNIQCIYDSYAPTTTLVGTSTIFGEN